MNFRDTYCVWCKLKAGPLEDCTGCPRFRRYELKQDVVLDAKVFCEVCRNARDEGVMVFCDTNRRLQAGSGEPFDCYKFSFDPGESTLKQAHVVTVFLTHLGKVCLVRRSAKVGTYQGLWSGISGYLEGDPSEHFRTEVFEETSLGPDDYTLLRSAEVVAVEDAQDSRMWYVHPFLCEVRDPGRISLDWENTEHRWFDPGEIRGLETVPGLGEVYERVSRLPLEQETAAFVQSLRNDRENGARQLAYQALDFLGRLVKSSNAADAGVLLDDLDYACHEISGARPSMAVIRTAVGLVLRDARTCLPLPAGEARAQTFRLVRSHMKDMDHAMELAVAHLDRILAPRSTVLVHSYSSSLIRALPLLKKKGCRLVVTESRPGFEGRTVAKMAADLGLKVRLVVDAAAGFELNHVDTVLMGADSIEQDGTVVNKTGSSLIAAAAAALGVKVFFLAEKRKICTAGQVTDLEEYGPEEVWDKAPAGVEVANLTFDRTAPGFITGIILEEGVVEPDRIAQIALTLEAGGRC